MDYWCSYTSMAAKAYGAGCKLISVSSSSKYHPRQLLTINSFDRPYFMPQRSARHAPRVGVNPAIFKRQPLVPRHRGPKERVRSPCRRIYEETPTIYALKWRVLVLVQELSASVSPHEEERGFLVLPSNRRGLSFVPRVVSKHFEAYFRGVSSEVSGASPG